MIVTNSNQTYFMPIYGARGSMKSTSQTLIFSWADLLESFLLCANLSGAMLYCTSMQKTQLVKANLSGSNLSHCDLSQAALIEANLSDATLDDANLTGTDLRGVIGLTQRQLDAASAVFTDEPPKLEGARCAETGTPLVWKGD